LPRDFPPVSTVQRFFYRWRDDGTWLQMNHALVMGTREKMGREASPTAGVIDTQSIKTTEAGGPRGFDAGSTNRPKGRLLRNFGRLVLRAGLAGGGARKATHNSHR
jgi:transposase